ncbi:flavodoxin [Scheffersomyces stipitis CBS 6054]|uniref:Flavodoxin n=1 Tax=Scheffersomyces stipitis (strain ATCC 58785 / CBS 6054 / NBRC 10063 / NRRL Y-11545) TaxID=322104 RepID=A3M050_PICST|nr:flavodoxin [Scheffersomyces stipitis CBS 6054]ABN68654.1 flavodoxin [Scheffersomyces stipitis CBS 6054]
MKIAILYYSTYGHLPILAKAIKEGIEETGLATQVDLFQVPETLSPEVLALLHAPEKDKDIPVATPQTLAEYDAFLFGIPTRFGTLPAQWIDFWGQTSGLWASGALAGKPAGLFVSSGSPGGGQEVTLRNSLSYLAHHGLIYVPLGYGKAFPHLTSFETVHGSSPWGSGTFAGADGSRLPNQTELAIAKIQGESFATTAIKFFNAKAKTLDPSAAPATADSSETALGTAQASQEKITKESKEAVKTAAKSTTAQRATQSAKSTAADAEKSSCAKCVIM